MLTVAAPERLNGERLRSELADAGLVVGEDEVVLVGGELRFVGLGDADRETVEQVLDTHTGEPLARPPAIEEQIADLYGRIDAAAALAENADATAQEVAKGLRDGETPA